MRHGLFVAPFGELSEPGVVAGAIGRGRAGRLRRGLHLGSRALRPAAEAIADPSVALAAVACATPWSRSRNHGHPVTRGRPHKLARETVTLDRLSGGRVSLVSAWAATPRSSSTPSGSPRTRVNVPACSIWASRRWLATGREMRLATPASGSCRGRCRCHVSRCGWPPSTRTGRRCSASHAGTAVSDRSGRACPARGAAHCRPRPARRRRRRVRRGPARCAPSPPRGVGGCRRDLVADRLWPGPRRCTASVPPSPTDLRDDVRRRWRSLVRRPPCGRVRAVDGRLASCAEATAGSVSSRMPAAATAEEMFRPLVGLCPREDSNLRTRFRKPMLYPLSYEGGWPPWSAAACRRQPGRMVAAGPASRPAPPP